MNSEDKYKIIYNDEYEELLIKMATASYIDDLGISIEKKKKELQQSKLFAFSEEELTNFKNEINKYEKKKQKAQWIKNIPIVGKRIAIFLGITSIVFIGGFTSVEAFRINILNLIISSTEKYTNISLKDMEINQSPQLPEEWGGHYYPHYIPEGFRVSKATIDKGIGDIIYINAEGKKIMYSIDASRQNIFLDTENVKFKELMINEWPAQLIEKQDYYTIIFKNDEYFFTVTGNISKKELINIAESIKK